MEASVASVALVSVSAPPFKESLPLTQSWEWSVPAPSSPNNLSARESAFILSSPRPPPEAIGACTTPELIGPSRGAQLIHAPEPASRFHPSEPVS
jgi:hypothetical protein